jgi:hypothetical protein
VSAGLQVKYLWHDIHVLEAEVTASNAIFSGAARTYIGIEYLAEAAQLLDGFPRNKIDIRELEFGAFGRRFAGGAAHLRFFCNDSAGHAVVEPRIASENESNTGSNWNFPEQNALFFEEIEASAVDEFFSQLRQLNKSKSGVASLRFAASPTR